MLNYGNSAPGPLGLANPSAKITPFGVATSVPWNYPGLGGFKGSLKSLPGIVGLQASLLEKPHIYEISKNTGKARELTAKEVEKKIGRGLTPKNSQYYILRDASLAKTSLPTIEKINDSSKCASALVTYAIDYLQTAAAEKKTGFPAKYYREFGKALFTKAIKLEGPDEGVGLTWKLFGRKVEDSQDTLPAYHIYESIVPCDGDNRYDKLQHFVSSAGLQFFLGKPNTDFYQFAKEASDELQYQWSSEGKGYDPLDMEANNEGQKYGADLFARHHPLWDKIRL